MKATRIHAHGGSDALRYEEADLPVPGPGEVLIRVAAAGVNPADYKHRSGMFKDFVNYVFPVTLGYDVAGTVAAIGNEVETPAPGTRVVALLDPMVAGGYAQFVTTAASGCAVIPDSMEFATAAAIPCPALTGTQMVEDHLRPVPGDTVLITGATGMVGRFAMLAAKRAGARVVAAVRAQYADEASRFGADLVVILDGAPWRGKPFDGVIDTVGGGAATALASATKPSGIILTAATDPLDASALPSAPSFVSVHPDGARLRRLVEDVSAGAVGIGAVERFPLADARAAHDRLEMGGVRGKIVLSVD